MAETISEPREFNCETCNRGFTSATGLGLHVRRAHPTVANERVQLPERKVRWTPEEVRLLAAAEAEAMRTGERFVNIYLVGRFPERSLEAIKGKRRNADYREMVKGLLQTRAGNAPEGFVPPIPDSATPAPQCDLGDIRDAIDRLVGEVDWSSLGERGEPLRHSFDNARSGVGTAEDVVAIIFSFLPQRAVRDGAGSVSRSPETNVSNKMRRRMEYAKAQSLYGKNAKALAHLVLDGRPILGEGGGAPNREEGFLEYWRDIFEQASSSSGRSASTQAGPIASLEFLWGPVTSEEVVRCRLKGSSAPGPDGVIPKDWNSIPSTLVAALFNLFMLTGRVPPLCQRTRTIFLPKTAEPQTPADYRPITIGSVIVRHFHKVLAERLTRANLVSENQRAFRPGTAGVGESLLTLSTLLADARTRRRQLHVATVDVSKAFDTVDHDALFDILTSLGLPPPMIAYLRRSYGEASTVFNCPAGNMEVRQCRGVRQGDPLSPALFNISLDTCLEKLSTDVGYELGDVRMTAIAFADDVVLSSSSKVGLVTNLRNFSRALKTLGLTVNSAKSRTLSLVPAGKAKKIKVLTTPEFALDGKFLIPLGLTDFWRYMGIDFVGTGVSGSGGAGVKRMLENLSRAPLKPQQRLHLLRTFLIPRLYHGLVLGRVTVSTLRKLDFSIRHSVRSWLHLPADVPIGYFHAPIKAGGIGVPQLLRFIPLLRLNHLTKMHRGPSFVKACAETPFVAKQIQWCRQVLETSTGGVPSMFQLKAFWSSMLHDSVDGKALRDSALVPESTHWSRTHKTQISGRDFVRYHAVRINALPSRMRTSRGRRTPDRSAVMCRAGCLEEETPAHVIQKCVRTHGGRILRHDAICKRVADDLSARGWAVTRERSFNTPIGVRRPDMVAFKGGAAVVIDAQVVAAGFPLDIAHANKVRKYAEEAGLADVLRGEVIGLQNIDFATVTVSWRGVWSRRSADSLRAIGVRSATLAHIASRALRGSWLNWWRFGASTISRMGGRPP